MTRAKGHEGHTYEDQALSDDYDPEFTDAMEAATMRIKVKPLPTSGVSVHEEGRRVGLHQAATHIRGEVARMKALQKSEWSGLIHIQINLLRRLARTIEKLK